MRPLALEDIERLWGEASRWRMPPTGLSLSQKRPHGNLGQRLPLFRENSALSCRRPSITKRRGTNQGQRS